MDLHFTKLHGTGNDFILFDNYDIKIKSWNNDLIKKLCEFHTGIGADGFIALEKDNQFDFRMRFFNSDGFESDMCVNGSRCLCYFAHSLGYTNKEMCFKANDGSHKAKIIEDEVEVQVNYNEVAGDKGFPDDYKLPEGVIFKNHSNTGVPHIVLETENVDIVDVYKIGNELRYHSLYQPEGINVNFVQKSDNGNFLRIRTYERGVESETLACGTGATAAALCYAKEDNIEEGEYKVQTNGGLLNVKYSDNFKSIYLRGPVKEVFKGIYSLEG
jgi:diaminopimelate epimerase